jgi:hypothetical protein
LYSAAKYPSRLETEMDQSTIDPIACTTSSIVVTVGIGGSGGGVFALVLEQRIVDSAAADVDEQKYRGTHTGWSFISADAGSLADRAAASPLQPTTRRLVWLAR